MSSSAESDQIIPAADDVADADSTQREMIGPYELHRPIGSGGMGTVYLAFDPRTKRSVAVKILPRDKASNPALVKRFHSEAESAAQLSHENIVNVYESGSADGYLYIAFEYIEGTDVSQLLKRGPLPIRRTIEIVKQVTRALDHAFQRGIVHRDVKPSNILIKRNGSIKLADMGLARSVDETLDSGQTREGTTVGTVDYMSPEQAQNSKSADVRSDIYSLGCAWYHMLTGSAPFPTGSITNKLVAHITNDRPDPRKANPDVPDQVAKIVLKMMHREPKERYQTPRELQEVLERISYRPDAFSDKFVSVLEAVAEPEQKGASTYPTRERPAARTRRSRRRTRRGTPRADNAFLIESLKNAGVVLAGLTAATLAWWIAVSLFFRSSGGG